MQRVVVVGGGIAGLATALQLVDRGAAVPGGLDVRLLEAAPRLGGNLRTEHADGFTVEQEGDTPRGGFAYLTHPDNPDQILELTELSPARRVFDAAIRRAADGWAGENPRRRFQDAV